MTSRAPLLDTRPAEPGFTPRMRSAEHGFTPRMRSAEHGFTLVEVMVSLMIFGMIAAAGVAILSFSIRAQAATTKRLDDGAALVRTISAMSADLGQAIPRAARDESGTLRPAFVGENGTLALVRGGWTNIDAAARPGAQKLVWQIVDGTLQRIGYPQLDGAAPLSATPMLTGVRDLTLRYRYNGAWSDRWDGAGGVPLPQAMEMRLTRRDGTFYRAMFLVGTGYAPPPLQPDSGLQQPGDDGSQAGNAN